LSDRPVRILYVHHRPELGGAPQSLFYLLENLDRTRFEAHVFCPGGAAAEIFADAGATVHIGPVASFTHIWASTYKGRRWLLFVRELWRLIGHVRAFRHVLRSNQYAIVHLNDSPLIPAAALARAAHIPVVWHLRSALPQDHEGTRTRLLRATIRKLARTTIAINADVARSFAVDSVVIPNAVDLERFYPADQAEARAELGLDGKPVVAYFGFIYPSKGFREFIDAAHLLRLHGVDASYLIVGGPVRGEEFFNTRFGRILQAAGLTRDHDEEAKLLVEELGLKSSVHFVPFTSDTPRIFQAADVIVAPSRGPELGRPVLEAAACGRVVVASGSIDGGGIVIPDETGILVPRRSADSLAAALEELLGNEPERRALGEAARRFAESNFDARRNAERVMAIYDDVLGSQ
jgi:glycosyltransferase involved in cell wall biosynthesis